MLARLIYGGGLALVAAQLLADGHVCGPGCSGAAGGMQGGVPYQNSTPLPPGSDSEYYGQRPINPSANPRGVMSFPQRQFAVPDQMPRERSFNSARSTYPANRYGHQSDGYDDRQRGRQRHHATGQRNHRAPEQTYGSQTYDSQTYDSQTYDSQAQGRGGWDDSQAYRRQPRDYGARPTVPQSNGFQGDPYRGPDTRNEDFRPIPQPSLPPQASGYRGEFPSTTPLATPRRQPWPSQRLRITPEPPAGTWKNI